MKKVCVCVCVRACVRACVCECVCFHIIPYENCFVWCSTCVQNIVFRLISIMWALRALMSAWYMYIVIIIVVFVVVIIRCSVRFSGLVASCARFPFNIGRWPSCGVGGKFTSVPVCVRDGTDLGPTFFCCWGKQLPSQIYLLLICKTNDVADLGPTTFS